MPKVLLGVTGSVAAIYTPELYQDLTHAGHEVKIVATAAALYFFDPGRIAPRHSERPERNPDVLILDEDEWPGRDEGRHYRRGDPVRHIELRRWADALVIAPLDANTLAKLANGLADNCLTCVWRAWDRSLPIILAPAMNTLMWEHPLTIRHLRQLVADFGSGQMDENLTLAELLEQINNRCTSLHVLAPQVKRLACDDVGTGAMASLEAIVSAVGRNC